jgi:selenocysteine lyase/cysteine desulfurase
MKAGPVSWKPHYSRFLAGHEGYLHLCAHSHHYWLDVTRDAQIEAWDDAARLSDRKWERVFAEILPDAQKGVAHHLGLSDPSRISFASNTHEFFVRLLSCFEEKRPLRVLSTDSEFHSFRRQSSRLVESGELVLEIVPQFPRETFAARFVEAAKKSPGFDMIFVSHVFFNSGALLPEADRVLGDLKRLCPMVVLDTYHSFLARPISLAAHEEDLFVLGGAYKYLQAGEGACFLYTPPRAEKLRPKFTGWYAHFGSLAGKAPKLCDYTPGALRFWGSTFDPTALYRLRAVWKFLELHQLSAARLHAHSLALQETCLEVLTQNPSREDWIRRLADSATRVAPSYERGNFLSFQMPAGEAREIQSRLEELKILCDSRETGDTSFLRMGFGLYHDLDDCGQLVTRLGL